MIDNNRIFDRWAAHYDSDISRAEQSGDWIYKDYTKILKEIVAVIESWKSGKSQVKVLDIGAGTGNLTSMIYDAGFKIAGIEPSGKMREKFEEKLPALKILRGDFINIPLQDDNADVIVSSYAWHHLTDDEKKESINEMVRVLKDPGLVVIADLMFADREKRETKINQLRQRGETSIIEDIESEYYVDISRISKCFNDQGFHCDSKQMTDYVWIVRAQYGNIACQ